MDSAGGVDVRGVSAKRRVTMIELRLKFFGLYDAGTPFGEEDHIDSSCFNELSDRSGVYVFWCRISEKALYVGKSHGRLNDRILQHYKNTNNGGTFRIHWCEAHCRLSCGDGGQNNKKQCNGGSGIPSYQKFKELVKGSELFVFSIGDERGEDSEGTERNIDDFEKFLIRLLKPVWNAPRTLGVFHPDDQATSS